MKGNRGHTSSSRCRTPLVIYFLLDLCPRKGEMVSINQGQFGADMGYHKSHFFLVGLPAKNPRNDGSRFDLCFEGLDGPGPGPTSMISGFPGMGPCRPGGAQPGGGTTPGGKPPGRRPGGCIPPIGGMGMPPPCRLPGRFGIIPGIFGIPAGLASIGHMVIVILQSGWTTLSQTVGNIISPFGPVKS